MNWRLIAAILLIGAIWAISITAVAHYAPPEGATDTASHSDNGQDKNANTTPPAQFQQGIELQSPTTKKQSKGYYKYNTEPDWWARIIGIITALATIALAIIGGIASCAAIKTLRILARQTAANVQAARAAEKSANVITNSERAWITVDIEWQDGPGKIGEGIEGGIEKTSAFIKLICTNRGKTPAWVERRSIKFEILDSWKPFNPELDATKLEPLVIDFDVLGANADSQHKGEVSCEGRMETGNTALIYGRVNYKDIFKQNRYTTFGYYIGPDKSLNRIPWAEKYNEHK